MSSSRGRTVSGGLPGRGRVYGPGFYRDASEYTEAEKELLAAVEQWMKANHCRFPTFTDVLHIMEQLGYRKVPHD